DPAGGDGTTGPGGLLNHTGDMRNTDPKLDSNGFQDNGGPTLTIALQADSPAINMGDPNFTPPPFYDQRGPGFDRVVNGRIDIGAFEAQSTPIPTPTPTPTPTATPTPNDFSISVSPSAETVLQGGSASYTVSTAVISGNAEQISLTLGPLPPGVSGSFTTDVVTTGNASTLNISAGTAAPATYTI